MVMRDRLGVDGAESWGVLDLLRANLEDGFSLSRGGLVGETNRVAAVTAALPRLPVRNVVVGKGMSKANIRKREHIGKSEHVPA